MIIFLFFSCHWLFVKRVRGFSTQPLFASRRGSLIRYCGGISLMGVVPVTSRPEDCITDLCETEKVETVDPIKSSSNPRYVLTGVDISSDCKNCVHE